ncbi:MAG: XRE family transcriptional regulator [Candidatus Symbiothrix sp.]|jgi:mannose-6-phosphate isomerase-like protein (cupin superfamily)|nr:XRE family transcriptional regulator [Candidatus Symbiothrix sp.]
MNEHIKEIAERLRGLRDSLDLSPAEMAEQCNRPVEDILHYETGQTDIPMSFLFDVSQRFNIDTSTLISGEEPRMTAYFLTRHGTGTSVERTKVYKYQSLAGGYIHPKAEPLEVTVEPNDNPIYLNTHKGEEFNYVLEGCLQFQINGKDLILTPGDSIYFDSSYPHGMKALDHKPVKFLAIIL